MLFLESHRSTSQWNLNQQTLSVQGHLVVQQIHCCHIRLGRMYLAPYCVSFAAGSNIRSVPVINVSELWFARVLDTSWRNQKKSKNIWRLDEFTKNKTWFSVLICCSALELHPALITFTETSSHCSWQQGAAFHGQFGKDFSRIAKRASRL